METADGFFKYSLVTWKSGEDKGKMSIVESNCIRGFEWIKLDRTGKPKENGQMCTCIVEWKSGKKKNGSWPLFDATLIRSSSK